MDQARVSPLVTDLTCYCDPHIIIPRRPAQPGWRMHKGPSGEIALQRIIPLCIFRKQLGPLRVCQPRYKQDTRCKFAQLVSQFAHLVY